MPAVKVEHLTAAVVPLTSARMHDRQCVSPINKCRHCDSRGSKERSCTPRTSFRGSDRQETAVIMRLLLILLTTSVFAHTEEENDGEASRKVLGSSVVTSVSVIMDSGNGSQVLFADAVGKPVSKPPNGSQLASPINLLNPDRYEFYTFDDSGDLVKRLMTLDEIQGIIANGDGEALNYDSQSLQLANYSPEKKVDDVVTNVQNVLKEELETHKNQDTKPLYDTPDVSSSWSMILPAIFGNSGEDIKPEKPMSVATPETIMIEPTTQIPTTFPPELKVNPSTSEATPQPSTLLVTSAKPLTTSVTTRKPSVAPTKATTVKKPATVLKPKPSTLKNPQKPEVISFKDSQYLQLPLISPVAGVTSTTKATPSTTVASTTQMSTTEPMSFGNTSSFAPQSSTFTHVQENFTTVVEDLQTSPTTIFSETLTTIPQQFPYKPEQEDVKNYLTTLADAYYSTTTSDNLSTPDKMNTEQAVSELLDQLLLTSTNIYQINSELADKTTTDNSDERFEITSEQTTDPAKIDSPKIYTTQEATKAPTTTETTLEPEKLTVATEENLMASIEQLISQAMGNIEETVDNQKEREKVQEMLAATNSKPMSNLQAETATIMSSIIGNPNADLIKNEPSLSESVGSLISQIVGVNIPSLTTVDGLSGELKTTEKTLQLDSTAQDRQDELELSTLESTRKTTTDEDSGITKLITTTESVNAPKPTKIDSSLETNSNNSEATTQNNLETRTTEESQFSTENTSDYVNETTTIYYYIKELITAVNNTDSNTAPSTLTNLDTVTENTEASTFEPATKTLTYDIHSKNANKIIEALAETTPWTTVQSTISQDDLTSTQGIQEKTTGEDDAYSSKDEEITWALVPTIAPHPTAPPTSSPASTSNSYNPSTVDLVPQSSGLGLEDTRANLEPDIYKFVDLCNELAFGFWRSVTTGISSARSVVASPFAASSLLAMVFLGARGSTSGEMNDILKLDDMATFNPHLIFRNVTESIEVSKKAGVAVSAIIRQLYSDKNKGKLLNFYKERARQFYDGHVEEANFEEIEDVIRRRTNLLVKRYTWGKLPEYLKENSFTVRPPLAAVSVSIFETDCSSASTENRDGELHFVVSPTIRQRRLIPIPAAVWRSNFLAGYDPSLDATAVAIGTKEEVISTIFVMPGQQGISAPGDGLARLEKHLTETAFKENSWTQLLRTLTPRQGLEVQIPRFSHRSVLNATIALQRMGLKDLFNPDKADLRGLNGVAHELHLSDMLQINTFATCGEGRIDETHHTEIYPATGKRSLRKIRKLTGEAIEPTDYQRAFHDPLHDPTPFSLPLPLRPRQARVPESPRLKFDRPFLYFVRHNPSGLVLHMGRFNPRLLP